MKKITGTKRYIKNGLMSIVCVAILFSLCACQSGLDKYSKQISELRYNAFEGMAGDMRVKAITGTREEPFEIDGEAGQAQNFTLITIEPSAYDLTVRYTYKTSLGGIEYTGDFVKHPFNNTYSAEIAHALDSNHLSISVGTNGSYAEGVLNSVIGENFISAEKAFDIALKKLKGSIKYFKNNKLSYEVFVRLTENPITSAGGYYWYVAFVGADETTFAVLIDPVDMSIAAIRS